MNKKSYIITSDISRQVIINKVEQQNCLFVTYIHQKPIYHFFNHTKGILRKYCGALLAYTEHLHSIIARMLHITEAQNNGHS